MSDPEGRLTFSKLMYPFGANWYNSLAVNTTLTESGVAVLAVSVINGSNNFMKTKCPTTLTPYCKYNTDDTCTHVNSYPCSVVEPFGTFITPLHLSDISRDPYALRKRISSLCSLAMISLAACAQDVKSARSSFTK